MIGKPLHYVEAPLPLGGSPTSHVTALCGLEAPERYTKLLSETECLACRRTKRFRELWALRQLREETHPPPLAYVIKAWANNFMQWLSEEEYRNELDAALDALNEVWLYNVDKEESE
jgi:hypothetical protein